MGRYLKPTTLCLFVMRKRRAPAFDKLTMLSIEFHGMPLLISAIAEGQEPLAFSYAPRNRQVTIGDTVVPIMLGSYDRRRWEIKHAEEKPTELEGCFEVLVSQATANVVEKLINELIEKEVLILVAGQEATVAQEIRRINKEMLKNHKEWEANKAKREAKEAKRIANLEKRRQTLENSTV